MRFYRRGQSLKHNSSARHRHLAVVRKTRQKLRQHRHIAFFEEIWRAAPEDNASLTQSEESREN